MQGPGGLRPLGRCRAERRSENQRRRLPPTAKRSTRRQPWLSPGALAAARSARRPNSTYSPRRWGTAAMFRIAVVHCVVCARPEFLPRRLLAAEFRNAPGASPRGGKATSQLARSGSWTSSRASIAALLSSSVRLNESIHSGPGAGSTAARQNHAADGKGDPDDHPDRSEVYETEHKANKHCRSDDRARLSSRHEPSAALDRFSEFLNTNLKFSRSAPRGARIRF